MRWARPDEVEQDVPAFSEWDGAAVVPARWSLRVGWFRTVLFIDLSERPKIRLRIGGRERVDKQRSEIRRKVRLDFERSRRGGPLPVGFNRCLSCGLHGDALGIGCDLNRSPSRP